MSAEQLGRRLLDETEEESLDILLSDIRTSHSSSQTSNLGIATLDQFFENFRRSQQSLQRPLWSSPQAFSEDDELYYDGLITPTPVGASASRQFPGSSVNAIQLTSSNSAVGKTSLLYYLSARAVLSQDHGGNESTFVWLDTDGRFSATRLAKIAEDLEPLRSAGFSKEDREIVVRDALAHVHVFRPQSSSQLLQTLKALPEYLFSRSRHRSQQRALGGLALDSATAFYWADRAGAEVARLSDLNATAPTSITSQIIVELREIAKIFPCTICFTTDASLQQTAKSRSNTDARTVADSPLPSQNHQTLQDPWSSFATLTLDVHRVPVPQFAPTMTTVECARDQFRRMEAVKRGRHRAQILWTGKESNEIRQNVSGLQNGEGFYFKVTGKGVEIE